jgi:hypothetical protein
MSSRMAPNACVAAGPLPPPRAVLDNKAPGRFEVDHPMVKRVHAYLRSWCASGKVSFLVESDEDYAKVTDKLAGVAAVLAASGRFPVQGFSVSDKGVRWAHRTRIEPFAHPYLYLSQLLRMYVDDVRLLFGPRCLNDHMIFQFEPMPAGENALLLARLERYMREKEAVCTL